MTIKRRKCGSCLKTRNGSNFLDDNVFACNKCLFPKKVCKSCGVEREISIKKCVNEHCVLHLRKYHLKKKNDFNDFKNRLYNNCNTRIINFGIQIYSRLKLKSQNNFDKSEVLQLVYLFLDPLDLFHLFRQCHQHVPPH